MNKYKLIDTFFIDQNDYVNFLVTKQLRTIANDEATCFAELKKEKECFNYTLTSLDKGKFIGDYIKPFGATVENINTFNRGCKILADLLSIYIDTGDINSIESIPLPFGDLTRIV